MDTLYGLGIMIALFVGASFLLFGIPKILKYFADVRFKVSKRIFETKNPKYELVRGGVLGLPSAFAVKRKFYTVASVDNKDHYMKVYKEQLHFHVTGNLIPRRFGVNTKELYKSLKAWRAWPTGVNCLAVEYKKAQNSTFIFSVDCRTDPSINEFLIEVLETDLLKALEKTIDL